MQRQLSSVLVVLASLCYADEDFETNIDQFTSIRDLVVRDKIKRAESQYNILRATVTKLGVAGREQLAAQFSQTATRKCFSTMSSCLGEADVTRKSTLLGTITSKPPEVRAPHSAEVQKANTRRNFVLCVVLFSRSRTHVALNNMPT